MSQHGWKHDDLQRDLATYLRETRGVLAWEDMQMGPVGSARPDVYTIGKSYAKFRPLVYEIKVSPADFRSDVTKGKWHSYLDYACGVIFAAPAGMIGKADLPAGCGLIQRSDAGWRMTKGPTLKALDNMPRDAWLKLLMDGVRREGERQRLDTRTANSWRTQQAVRKKHGEDVAELLGRAMMNRGELERAMANEQDSAQRIRKLVHEREQQAMQHAERQAMQLSAAQTELAMELGLDGSASARELTTAIRSARQRLGEDAEVRRMRRLFDTVQRACSDALEELPGADNDNVPAIPTDLLGPTPSR